MPLAASSTTANPSSHLFRRVALIAFGTLFILLAAGFVYERTAESHDRHLHPPPGRLVDVQGRKMHIHCAGEGDPTVILDSGLGDSYLSWAQGATRDFEIFPSLLIRPRRSRVQRAKWEATYEPGYSPGTARSVAGGKCFASISIGGPLYGRIRRAGLPQHVPTRNSGTGFGRGLPGSG